MRLFFKHATAAKGLLLSSVTVTAALVLLSPTSLTARAADLAGNLADAMAVAALLMTAVGWLDVAYTDTTGRLIWPSLKEAVRHKACVLLYSAITGWYAVFAFVAVDPRVGTSWVLVAYYLAIATFGAVLTIAIAQEPRKEGGG